MGMIAMLVCSVSLIVMNIFTLHRKQFLVEWRVANSPNWHVGSSLSSELTTTDARQSLDQTVPMSQIETSAVHTLHALDYTQ